MTAFDLPGILASKKRYRSKLAALPYEEKLRLLEAMRKRHQEFIAAREQNKLKSNQR